MWQETGKKAMNTNKKIKTVGVRFPEGESNELDRIADILDVPTAQIVREAVREKVAKLQRHPKVKAAEPVETA